MITETITIKSIDRDYVEFTGSKYIHACNSSYFPQTPKVGEQYILETNDNPDSRDFSIRNVGS